MKIKELNKFLQTFQEHFSCVIGVKETRVESNVFIILFIINKIFNVKKISTVWKLLNINIILYEWNKNINLN